MNSKRIGFFIRNSFVHQTTKWGGGTVNGDSLKSSSRASGYVGCSSQGQSRYEPSCVSSRDVAPTAGHACPAPSHAEDGASSSRRLPPDIFTDREDGILSHETETEKNWRTIFPWSVCYCVSSGSTESRASHETGMSSSVGHSTKCAPSVACRFWLSEPTAGVRSKVVFRRVVGSDYGVPFWIQFVF